MLKRCCSHLAKRCPVFACFTAFACRPASTPRLPRAHCLRLPSPPAGPYGTWKGGREKAPAAFCRKALTAEGEVEMWGDGKQTRSFTFIDDCVEGILRITKSDFREPLNLGSTEMVRKRIRGWGGRCGSGLCGRVKPAWGESLPALPGEVKSSAFHALSRELPPSSRTLDSPSHTLPHPPTLCR
jgi:hypothetical protein